MIKHHLEGFIYQSLIKPVLFQFDAASVHEGITWVGEGLENNGLLINTLLSYSNPRLQKTVLGINFPNPVGLSAGFDYDGHLANVLSRVGFGFNTVGTVTAKAYRGNPGVMLARLPKSKSLLVNKGFKSEGAEAVARRLETKNLTTEIVGISVGSSNLPEVDTVNKAIDDYLFTFNVFKNKPYVKYFELNISCPNTAMTESFTKPKYFQELVMAVKKLRLKKPVLVKMPNEIEYRNSDELVRLALSAGIRGFIFSNLVKKRDNPELDKEEVAKFKNYKGNFSGRPTAKNARNLVKHTREEFGKEVALVSVGGIFTSDDAWERFAMGADLVQLITGMIYQGPQLPGEINYYLAKGAFAR